METSIEILKKLINEERIEKVVMASPVLKTGIKKIEVKPFKSKGEILYQISFVNNKKAIHQNFSVEEIMVEIEKQSEQFKQINVFSDVEEFQILRNSKGNEKIIKKEKEKKEILIKEHNKKKEYIIQEGEKFDFLIHLGVMDTNGKVFQKKYDKFRQINRYLEFISDVVKEFPTDRKLKIVDFGSGKAYLTFALYYYLVKRLKMDILIF